MRAIENNVPVIRSANTGVSRIIDGKGRIVGQTKVNERCTLSGKVSFAQSTTLYTRIGDIFVGVAFVSVLLVLAFCKKKKPFITENERQ
jgi:apolipoprotein N-acyltransferase